MSKSPRSYRTTASRSLILAIAGTVFLSIAAAGTSAAGLSFIDSVRGFFGFSEVLTAGNQHPNLVLNTDYHSLNPGNGFFQGWTNTGLITVNDDWFGVPAIMGYRGDDAVAVSGVDPQTILVDLSTPVDVNANRSDPDVFTTGGVTEFDGIANPVVALTGSGTADFPHIDLRFETSGCPSPANTATISYTIRDIDGSADDAIQQVALQYRVGSSGNYINIPAGYVADATTGGTATQTTFISVPIPVDALGQTQVHFRVMTSNAVGSDEWVGIDDITVICSVAGGPSPTPSPSPTVTPTPTPTPDPTPTPTPTPTPSVSPSPVPTPPISILINEG